jgi:hypothetical protein
VGDSLGYIEIPCLKKQNKQTKNPLTCTMLLTVWKITKFKAYSMLSSNKIILIIYNTWLLTEVRTYFTIALKSHIICN